MVFLKTSSLSNIRNCDLREELLQQSILYRTMILIDVKKEELLMPSRSKMQVMCGGGLTRHTFQLSTVKRGIMEIQLSINDLSVTT